MALVEAGQLEDAVHHGAVALVRVEVEEMALGNDGDQAGGVDGLPAWEEATLSLLLLRIEFRDECLGNELRPSLRAEDLLKVAGGELGQAGLEGLAEVVVAELLEEVLDPLVLEALAVEVLGEVLALDEAAGLFLGEVVLELLVLLEEVDSLGPEQVGASCELVARDLEAVGVVAEGREADGVLWEELIFQHLPTLEVDRDQVRLLSHLHHQDHSCHTPHEVLVPCVHKVAHLQVRHFALQLPDLVLLHLLVELTLTRPHLRLLLLPRTHQPLYQRVVRRRLENRLPTHLLLAHEALVFEHKILLQALFAVVVRAAHRYALVNQAHADGADQLLELAVRAFILLVVFLEQLPILLRLFPQLFLVI